MAANPTTVYNMKRVTPAFNASQARTIAIKMPAGQYLSGQILGELTATPGTAAPYAVGNSDGSQVPKYILEYDTFVDASGNHYRSDNGSVNNFGSGAELSAPVYYSGNFFTSDLVTSGAGAITDAGLAAMFGKMVAGANIAAGGVIHIG